ncbi:hypothetical protein CAPTEDRAFT_93538 [Capitella teleta]|uniref:Aminotransferase class V domain-containing protein n=1 Tax=Capitella teleta TaxID=283909 RepID=R7UDM5_CAPTE|nr:hypothetical protein CAPTEDRAFT_93538 [Capitella teleta]|eukprot:ELU04084.1 hypothetical protein CAPTEDRAFT_93538 [Capitella teleta]
MYGLNVGRYHHFPEIKTKGMQALPNICLFTSELSHYSIKKGVAWMGMGLDCVKTVPCDTRGRMIPKKLEEMVIQSKEEGFTPFLVNATSGTTVAGAFDPLDAIADIAEKHNLWMHVDACWGGGLLFSDQQRHKLNGVHRSDSVAWNAHKLLGAPLQCCVFLTKHKDLLRRAHSANAQYLFQQDKFYDVSYDTGDMSIQCGRKVDVLKLWMMWKAKGSSGFAADVNHLLSLADYFTQKIKTIEGFRMVYPEPECTNICFWYIPKEFRSQEAYSDEWWKRLAKVAPLIKERMIMKGSMMVGYNPEGSKVNFFRVLLSNTRLRQKDCDFMIAEIQRLGEDIPY